MTPSTFLGENFLLEHDSAVRLYHEYAKDMPILDYHSHLSPGLIAEDHRFGNMTEIWLRGDHYKWRAMRANGVPEYYCTGNASDYEKFLKWAETVPKLLRNPLFHWTHMELQRPFGIDDRLLNPETAAEIWETCSAKLALPEFTCRGLLRYFNVTLVCTTDDPTDDLQAHRQIARDSNFPVQVLPTFRPDRAMLLQHPERFHVWVDKLSETSGIEVKDYTTLIEALRKRHDYFHEHGCRLSDHGIEQFVAEDYEEADLNRIFREVYNNQTVSVVDRAKFKSAVLYECALMNYEKGWSQQFHVGALRNVNSKMFETLGPDTGFDAITDINLARNMTRFLDRLERQGKLSRTIVYNLNPAVNETVASILACYQDGSEPAKMQFGAAWWFLDQRDGILRQLETLSNFGLLSRFVGMLTDSRSFLSFTRHDYFRRILCNLLGGEMDRGLLPKDEALLGSVVRDICYNNAARYFGFRAPTVHTPGAAETK
ncbi:glucuronate isomerase [Thermopirellula anaerolimosa]